MLVIYIPSFIHSFSLSIIFENDNMMMYWYVDIEFCDVRVEAILIYPEL